MCEKIKIVNFQSNYGSGKKTVVSGSASYGNTTYNFINKDITGLRVSVAKTLGIKNTAKVTTRIRTLKERTKVEELKSTLAVARRLPKKWVKIDIKELRTAFKDARMTDRKNKQEALKEKAVSPLLAKIAKLSDEERALLLASLQ